MTLSLPPTKKAQPKVAWKCLDCESSNCQLSDHSQRKMLHYLEDDILAERLSWTAREKTILDKIGAAVDNLQEVIEFKHPCKGKHKMGSPMNSETGRCVCCRSSCVLFGIRYDLRELVEGLKKQ